MLVDAYQGAGALPLRAADVADVVVGGTVKYLLASAGLAYMYVGDEVRRRLPTQTGWFADENIFEMQIASYRPHPTARRYDAGTPPVPSIYGGLAGVDLIMEAGVPAIEEHVRGLVERLARRRSTSSERRWRRRHDGPLVCVRSTDAPALVDALAAEGIVASERDSSLRGSRCISTTPPRTSTPSSRRCARNRQLLL